MQPVYQQNRTWDTAVKCSRMLYNKQSVTARYNGVAWLHGAGDML